MENELQREPATPEEIWAILREVSKEQRELSRQQKQTDRQMKKLAGLFTSQWEALMESLVEGDLVPLLQARGVTRIPVCVAGVTASTMSLTSWPRMVRKWWWWR